MAKVKGLKNLVIDEVSLVDKGANQHATVAIAKRHAEEETDMPKFYDEGGNEVEDLDTLEIGDVVFDENGDAFEVSADEDEAELDEREPELVGKSYVNPFAVQEAPQSGLVEEIRKALSAADSDDERDAVISKAFSALEQVSKQAEQAQLAAEQERQLRLDREYTEVAKNYNVGIAPEVLGPVLKRAAEALSHEDCQVIAKALDSASAANFDEYGVDGYASNSDVLAQVDQYLDGAIAKSDMSREEAISKVFEMNPEEYDNYLAERRGH